MSNRFDRNQFTQYAEDYLLGRLNADTLQKLNDYIRRDPALEHEWKETLDMMRVLHGLSNRSGLRSKIRAEHTHYTTQSSDPLQKAKKRQLLSPSLIKLSRNAAAILIVAVLSSLFTSQFFIKDNKSNQETEFISLKRDIQNIKNSQAELKQSIDDNHKADTEPQYDGNIAGTGFAVTNDGFLATDYHVVDKADSIFVKTDSESYLKAYLVAFDQKHDVALLKIEDNQFRFAKSDIPYVLNPSKAALAQSIYSIGYPQDNVFYSEGYISSHTSADGSTHQYQLELPANPGQSGSPVFDQNGYIIGMLLGKKNYATYAVQTQSIIDLIKSLPKEHKIKLTEKNQLKNQSRTDQVKKASAFVYPVVVFKG